MAVHDWTLVEAGIFHHFHVVWTGRLSEELRAILPKGYYALAEQHLGRKEGDVLALHASEPAALSPPEPPEGGAVAVAEAPPQVNRTLVASLKTKRRTITIRHISGHRIIALVEFISPSNKSSANSVSEFIEKAAAALRAGIHLVLVDLFPPSKHDPQGMHAALWDYIASEEYMIPPEKNLTIASYSAGSSTATAYVEHVAVGDPLKDMPLFLTSERYVNLPLASTYEMTFDRMPDFWRDVLKGQS